MIFYESNSLKTLTSKVKKKQINVKVVFSMSINKFKNIANKLVFEGKAYINGKYVDTID